MGICGGSYLHDISKESIRICGGAYLHDISERPIRDFKVSLLDIIPIILLVGKWGNENPTLTL